MNSFTWIILAFIVALYLVDSIAALLNMTSLRKTLPAEFEGVYDQERYASLQEYTRVNGVFQLLESTFDLAVLIVFWLAGGFGFLDSLVRGLHWGPIPSGLLYIGVLAFGRGILALPFDAYHTFAIEERFGFNKTTPKVYITDHLKGYALSLLLGAPVLALVLAYFQYAGPRAWLYGWLTASALLLLMAWLAPAVIMPLFNKFKPLEEGSLRRAILDYAAANRVPLKGIFVMDGSRRSTKANAFFSGLGATKKIVLYDTLIQNHTVEELVAVLAHEVGHFKLHHIIQHLVVGVANLGIFFLLAAQFISQPVLHAAFGVHTVSVYCGFALFLVVFSPLSQALSVLAGFQSRLHEYEADRFAAQTTAHPDAMVDALKKLAKNNLSNLSPHPLLVILHHSHPPLLDRIRAIRQAG